MAKVTKVEISEIMKMEEKYGLVIFGLEDVEYFAGKINDDLRKMSILNDSRDLIDDLYVFDVPFGNTLHADGKIEKGMKGCLIVLKIPDNIHFNPLALADFFNRLTQGSQCMLKHFIPLIKSNARLESIPYIR